MSLQTCPVCTERARVTDSRQYEGVCRRRFVCPNGHRYTTFETYEKSYRGVSIAEQVRQQIANEELLDKLEEIVSLEEMNDKR